MLFNTGVGFLNLTIAAKIEIDPNDGEISFSFFGIGEMDILESECFRVNSNYNVEGDTVLVIEKSHPKYKKILKWIEDNTL